MNISILRSSFQTDDFVWNEYADLIQQLKNNCQAEITIIGDEAPSSQKAPNVVMIATGGVENLFKRIWLGESTTLIADGRNNSLAAALEILTWLGTQGVEGRILHGTNDEIIAPLVEAVHAPSLQGVRIGLFGQPSDWLIASGVDRPYLKDRFGVETIDIDLQRLINGIKTEFYRRVTVSFQSLYLYYGTRTCLYHRYGNNFAVRRKQLRHAEFLSNDCFIHR